MPGIVKTFWSAFAGCLLLTAESVAQGPAQTVESADSTFGESIQQQIQASQGTILYFPNYVDGGGWSVQLALSILARSVVAAIVVTANDPESRLTASRLDHWVEQGTA